MLLAKLHIIENRYRTEQQIMFGRQAVRQALRRVRSNQTPTDTDGVIDDSIPPKSLAGTRLVGTSTSTELPLATDTDTERAFANNGMAWYFRRGRPTVKDTVESGTSTPGDAGYTNATDPLRSPVFRRKWASDLLESRGSPDGDIPASRDRSPPRRASSSIQSTFFAKLGRKSVSALTIPFSSPLRSSKVMRSREPSLDGQEPPWSSDTSSEEEEIPFYESKFVRTAGLRSPVQNTQIDPDYGGPLEDVDSN